MKVINTQSGYSMDNVAREELVSIALGECNSERGELEDLHMRIAELGKIVGRLVDRTALTDEDAIELAGIQYFWKTARK